MVVLSGMTSQPAPAERACGCCGATAATPCTSRARSRPTTSPRPRPLDEQMDDEERRRLLYVAATRARDHLVVSLHRADRDGDRDRGRDLRRTPARSRRRA